MFFSAELLTQMRTYESHVPVYSSHADHLGSIIEGIETEFTKILNKHLQTHHQVCILFSLVENQY